jgi:hypothetical protein
MTQKRLFSKIFDQKNFISVSLKGKNLPLLLPPPPLTRWKSQFSKDYLSSLERSKLKSDQHTHSRSI